MEWFYNNKFLHFTLYVSIELFSHSRGIMPLSDDNISVKTRHYSRDYLGSFLDLANARFLNCSKELSIHLK